MRILFLSQLLPLPLDAGPKIRSYYVLRRLVEAGHDVTLLCFVRPTDKASDVEAFRHICQSVETVPMVRSRLTDLRKGVGSVLGGTPFLIDRDWLPPMAEMMTRLASKGFDAVHADQLWMAPYAASCPNVGIRVLDQHNAVFKVPARLAKQQSNPVIRALVNREASKLEAFERNTIGEFDDVVWVSEEDRAEFKGVATKAGRVQPVIPIAVDPLERQPMSRRDPFRVTFLGGLHWPPNAEGVRWFVEQGWSRVAQAVPNAVLTVVGKGSLGKYDPGPYGSRIDVTGYVENVDRYIAETAVFIVPLQTGAGMRVKILDAWCWGLPIVSTTVGAEGIKTSDGDDLLIADEPAVFAEHVVRVLEDHALASRLSDGGRAAVESCYDWRKVYRAWDAVYR